MPDGMTLTSPSSDLTITSHIGRAFLHSAEQFRNEAHVTWEYVVNGLQYRDPGVAPVVTVSTKNNRLVIKDNGRGMDYQVGLRNFFILNGENQDRASGQSGRGKFGTGKSAAFAIANEMQITTVHRGRRTRVSLHEKDLREVKANQTIPVTTLEREVPTKEPSGTEIEIRDLRIKPNRQMIIAFIQKNIATMPGATVIVDGFKVEYQEPASVAEYTFRPNEKTAAVIGDAVLTIKVSRQPLRPEQAGVSITCNGTLHEVTLVGNENKDGANRIFGSIDVPALDDENAPVKAFDSSRSLRLNPANKVVARLHMFIAAKIDEVRKLIAEQERKQRVGEELERLQTQVNSLAKLLNQEVANLSGLKPAGMHNPFPIQRSNDTDQEEPPIQHDKKRPGDKTVRGTMERTDSRNDAKPPRPAAAKHQRSGFNITLSKDGADMPRAQCARGSRNIVINVEHPQIAAILSRYGIDHPAAIRAVWEAAVHRFCITVAHELSDGNEFEDHDELLSDLDERIDRIFRQSAVLYN